MRSLRILLLFFVSILTALGDERLTNETVIHMVQAGVGVDLIVQTIRAADTFQFGLLPGDLIALGQAHVPEAVVKAMAQRLNHPSPQPEGATVEPALPAQGAGPVGSAFINPEPPLPLHAEPGFSRAEVFGGYTYLSVDAIRRFGFNGWQTASIINVNRWVGVEGNFSGTYGLKTEDYLLVGGPRFTFRQFFAHALVGANGLPMSRGIGLYSVAAVFGGGMQVPVGHGFAVQPFADYVFTHYAVAQNNIRVGGGVVYRFGRAGTGPR